MPVTLANCRQKCSVLLYGIGDAAFLSLASYARTHDLNSKAKVTAISGKAS
jgi:hypothetical protein